MIREDKTIFRIFFSPIINIIDGIKRIVAGIKPAYIRRIAYMIEVPATIYALWIGGEERSTFWFFSLLINRLSTMKSINPNIMNSHAMISGQNFSPGILSSVILTKSLDR
jgi:hypothetical protein